MKAFIFIRDIFKKYPALLLSNILLLVLVSLIEAVSLFSVAPLVDFVTKSDLKDISPVTQWVVAAMNFFNLPATLGSWLIFLVGLVTLDSILYVMARHSILRTKYTVLRDLMLGTFEDFFRARWYFFSSSKQGVFLNTFIRQIDIVGAAFGWMALFFAELLQLLFYLAVPFYISWQVTSISLLATLLFSWPLLLLGKLAYQWGKQNTATANKLSSVIYENLGLAKIILGFGNQRRAIENFEGAFDADRRVTIKAQTLQISVPRIYRPLGIMVLIISLFSARKFAVPLSEMAVLLLGLVQVINYIGRLTTGKTSIENFFPSYEQVLSLRKRARELKQKTGTRKFSGFTKEISVEKLSFTYPEHKPTLVDVNVRIPKGKMIAFVGESGSGKTTLIDVIMGFHQPLKGEMKLDGVTLENFDIDTYRQRLGYVPQESVLFNLSIRDNLRWAKVDASDEEIKQACQEANAEQFIEAFPHKYDTLVGDRGVRLSGGQTQRVALARAILRKPDILILDEATSSLDTQSERLIQEAIENIAKETTVIVIAHRLSTVVSADYIYVLKSGRVIEQGTYPELIQMNGEFHRMAKLQVLETVN